MVDSNARDILHRLSYLPGKGNLSGAPEHNSSVGHIQYIISCCGDGADSKEISSPEQSYLPWPFWKTLLAFLYRL
jgi:hypothetical protein